MAVRTGTQIKGTDVAAADAALATAITTPSDANVAAAKAAFDVVVTNGRDTDNARSAMRSDGQGSVGKDLQVLAKAASRDLQLMRPASPDADKRKQLSRLQRNLNGGLWGRVRNLATAD